MNAVTPGDLFIVHSLEKYVLMLCNDGSTLRVKNDEYLIFITTEPTNWPASKRFFFLTQNGYVVWTFAYDTYDLLDRGIRQA